MVDRYTKIEDIKADKANLDFIIFFHFQLLAAKAYDAPAGFGPESKRTMIGFLSLIRSLDACAMVLCNGDEDEYLVWKQEHLPDLTFENLLVPDKREKFLDLMYQWIAQIYN